MAAGQPEGLVETTAAEETPAVRKKPRAPTTITLISKMRTVLARRILEMEKEPMETAEREMALLTTMARTLGKLQEMRRSSQKSTTKRKATASPEMIELRKKIAARIEQLNRS